MTLRFLSESPTHFLDAIRLSINNNKFIKDDALMMLDALMQISFHSTYLLSVIQSDCIIPIDSLQKQLLILAHHPAHVARQAFNF